MGWSSPAGGDRPLNLRVDAPSQRYIKVEGGDIAALRGLWLHVQPAAFVVVVGPPGSGKTALLRTLAGLERSGGATADLQGAGAGRPLFALAFPPDSVFPWLTVAENIGYGLRLLGWLPEHRRDAAEHYACRLDLWRYLDRQARELPPDVLQRVSVARALAYDAEILLLDEPLSHQPGNESLRAVLQEVRASRRHTVLCTVAAGEEPPAADRVVLL